MHPVDRKPAADSERSKSDTDSTVRGNNSGFVGWLASIPMIFDALRWILEGGYHGHRTVFDNELRQSATAGIQVLDLGCGTGIHASRFRPDDYLGVDLSSSYIDAARRKFRQYRFEVADARRLSFASGAFQTVLISGVLHHLNDNDASAVLSEAARVTARGGSAVIWEDVPCLTSWNPVGSLIHRLDQGEWIRTPSQYRALVERWFHVESERSFRSGFMDYVVFRAVPK